MGKGGWILLIVAATLIIVYFLFKDKIGNAVAAHNDKPYDAGDKATFDAMVAAIKASPYRNDVDYILKSYYERWAPGQPGEITDNYGSVNGHPTMSGGLLSTVFTAWLGTYNYTDWIGKHEHPTATALARDLAGKWETYRNKTVSNYLKNA
jgi:hypothetical protein